MIKKTGSSQRRVDSLSRDRIIETSIAILDSSGEDGLTFRTLSERLATGPGAIYWHVANKAELMTAACDAIVAPAIDTPSAGATPQARIRALALGLFDAIDAHPWVGSALAGAPEQPMVRILERVGREVRALGVPDERLWATTGTLLNYILGVGGQNAANGQLARTRGIDRTDFLEAVSTAWSKLDPEAYPFTRSMAAHLRAHDDRADFLAGIDLILAGIEAGQRH